MPNTALKILVVDDDPLVAAALARDLGDHRPTVETDPEQAHRRLIEGEWFDVVVCDAVMPGRDGTQLLAAARTSSSPPIFVLMSGDEMLEPDDADVTIQKPFAVASLLELLMVLVRQKSRAPTKSFRMSSEHAQ